VRGRLKKNVKKQERGFTHEEITGGEGVFGVASAGPGETSHRTAHPTDPT